MNQHDHPVGELHTMLLTDYKLLVDRERDYRDALIRIAHDRPNSPGDIAWTALKKHQRRHS